MAQSNFNGIAPLTPEEIAERDARVDAFRASSQGTTVRDCRTNPITPKYDGIAFAPAIVRSRYNLRLRSR